MFPALSRRLFWFSASRSSSFAAGDVRDDSENSLSSILKVRARFLMLSLDERNPS